MYVKDIRQQLQKQLGSSIYQLVEKVLDSEISITENNKNAKLKKLILTDLPASKKCQIWRINLEKMIPGLSTANKTGEIALVVLKNKYLNVYLIELKSMIKDTTLKAIQDKIQDSINRFYFLLSINSEKDHEIFKFKELKIRFIALIFFDGHDKITNATDPKFENIYEVFKKRSGKLSCNTLLERVIIPIKFFSEGFDKTTGSLKMNWSDIENEIKSIRGI